MDPLNIVSQIAAIVGAFIGLVILWTGDASVGTIVVLTVSCYMLLSSLAMALADMLGKWRPRGGSLWGIVGSSIPPLVVLTAAAL